MGAWSWLSSAPSRPTRPNPAALSARSCPPLWRSASSIPVASRDDRFDWPRSSAPDSMPPRERLNPERVRRSLSRRGPRRAPRQRHVLACEVHWERAARAPRWRRRAQVVLLPQSSRTRLGHSRVGGHRQHLKPKNPRLSSPRRLCRATRLARAKTAFRREPGVDLARAEQAPDRQVLAPGSEAPRARFSLTMSSLRVV